MLFPCATDSSDLDATTGSLPDIIDTVVSRPLMMTLMGALAVHTVYGTRCIVAGALKMAYRIMSGLGLGRKQNAPELAVAAAGKLGQGGAMTFFALRSYARISSLLEGIAVTMLVTRLGGAVSNGLVEAEAEGTLLVLAFGAICIYAVGAVAAGTIPFDLMVLLPRALRWRTATANGTKIGSTAAADLISSNRAGEGLVLIIAVLASLRLGHGWRDHAQEGVIPSVARTYVPAALLAGLGIWRSWILPSGGSSHREQERSRTPTRWLRFLAQGLQAAATGCVVLYWRTRHEQGAAVAKMAFVRLALPRLGYLFSAAAVAANCVALYQTWGPTTTRLSQVARYTCLCFSRLEGINESVGRKSSVVPSPPILAAMARQTIGGNLVAIVSLQDAVLTALAAWPAGALVLGPNAPGTILLLLVLGVSLPLLVAWVRVTAIETACRQAADAAVELGWADRPADALSDDADTADASGHLKDETEQAVLSPALQRIAAARRRKKSSSSATSVREPAAMSAQDSKSSTSRDFGSFDSKSTSSEPLQMDLVTGISSTSILNAVLVYGVCAHAFYTTGHASQFSSIDFAAPFVGFDAYDFTRGVVVVALNSYWGLLFVGVMVASTGFIFFAGAVEQLLLQQARLIEAKGKEGLHAGGSGHALDLSTVVVRHTASILLVVGLVAVVTLEFTCFARRHLMVWALFAPKFVFESVTLVVLAATATIQAVVMQV